MSKLHTIVCTAIKGLDHTMLMQIGCVTADPRG